MSLKYRQNDTGQERQHCPFPVWWTHEKSNNDPRVVRSFPRQEWNYYQVWVASDLQRYGVRCSDVIWNHVEELLRHGPHALSPRSVSVVRWQARSASLSAAAKPLLSRKHCVSTPRSHIFSQQTQVQPLDNKFSSQTCNVPHELAEWAQLACTWLYGYLEALWQIILLLSAHICQRTDLIWSYGFT